MSQVQAFGEHLAPLRLRRARFERATSAGATCAKPMAACCATSTYTAQSGPKVLDTHSPIGQSTETASPERNL